MHLHTAPSSSALSQTTVEVTIREEYLLRNKTNIARTLCVYSLDQGPWHETDDARFIFRFTWFDWINTIEQLLHREHIHCDAVRSFDTKVETASKKIVIAGCDDRFSSGLASGLEAAGYRTKSYSTARAAIEGSLLPVDLFIVDKQAPDMDALNICRHLRAYPSTKHVPIILLSEEAKKLKEALLAGATDCVKKPFHIHYLLHVISRYVVTTLS